MSTLTLRIRLLGEFGWHRGATLLPPLESARAESLLAYLILKRHSPQPRQRLAFVLWPDSTEGQARTNLRHVLHLLRQALPDPDRFLEATPRTLRWRPDAPALVDVFTFEDALDRSQHDATGAAALLQQAIGLYGGELLETRYDEWMHAERDRLRRRFLDALERLAALLEARRDYGTAILYAERLVRHDPLNESAYRRLMRLHNARGDRARAVRVYHLCSTALERELGVEPAAPTRAAYEALLQPEHHPVATPSLDRVAGPMLVGRVQELKRLQSCWQAAQHGRAMLVLVTGEAGIGKTRLVEELRHWCAQGGAVIGDARSYAAEGAIAYATVASWLRSDGFGRPLSRLDPSRRSDLARLLPELFERYPDLARPEPLPESEQRARLFDALIAAMRATTGPTLLIADDIHWCDRESLRFLHYLLRSAPDAPLLVTATARSEDVPANQALHDLLAGMQSLECVSEIQLGRLTREQTAVLGAQMTGAALAQPVADRLHHETEGNPLFIVEALRAASNGTEGLDAWLAPKAQAVIEARLTQLSRSARELAGLAATIGREFTPEVLIRAAGLDDEQVVRGLDELWRRGIIRNQNTHAYDFSHGKLREGAYRALSPARRHHHHLRVAQALEQLYGDAPGRVAGHIAAHYDQAGAFDVAAHWYAVAAEAALQLHASSEVVHLLSRALDLLHLLPETRERQTRELALLSAMPAPLGGVEGYASQRLRELQQRALNLAAALAVEPSAPLVRSLAIASLSHGDFAAARQFGEQLQARGERENDDVLVVEGQYVLGIAAFWQGEFEAARRHFAVAVDRYRPEHRRAHLLRYGLDPKVTCLSRLGNTLWFLGYPDAAARARDAARALADEVEHHYSRGTALVFAALLAVDMREPERLRAYAAELQHDVAQQWRPTQVVAEALNGYVAVLNGQREAGIRRLQQALSELGGVDHAPGMQASIHRLLVEACVVAGDDRAGLVATRQTFALNNAARVWEAEMHRLHAEFLASTGAPWDEVKAELEHARVVARHQGAVLFELRATASLVRHRTARGDAAGAREARGLLATLVDALAGASHTPDVIEAAALLGRS